MVKIIREKEYSVALKGVRKEAYKP